MMRWNLQRVAQPLPWLVFALAVGLSLRCYHYLSNPPVWHDEAALIVNVLGKNFTELLGPLFYSEAAPPLFLWLERAVALGLGDSTYALRLFPFLASCVAFLASVALARHLLPAWGVVWFALLLGCSDRLLWHCCEAKPYAVDVLLAVGMLATFVGRRADDDPLLFRQLVLYASLSPLLIFLSFPACFLLGGAALVLLPAVLRSRSRRIWGTYILFGVLLCGSFLLLVVGPVHAQKNEYMLNCWNDNFPDWNKPWKLPQTALVRLTELFRYASEPIGNVLSVFAVVGAVWLWRTGQRKVLAYLVLPIGLTAVAWLAHQYPLGAARVVVFAAPAALLLVAAGLPPTFGWLRKHAWPASLVAAGLLLFPVFQSAYRVVVPWSRLDSAQAAALVLQKRQTSEPVLGSLWEHTYYFRKLGPLYRVLDPQPTEPPTLPLTSPVGLPHGVDGQPAPLTSVWIVCMRAGEDLDWCKHKLKPTKGWSLTERFPFANMVVLHLTRSVQMAAGPVRPAE